MRGCRLIMSTHRGFCMQCVSFKEAGRCSFCPGLRLKLGIFFGGLDWGGVWLPVDMSAGWCVHRLVSAVLGNHALVCTVLCNAAHQNTASGPAMGGCEGMVGLLL